MSRTAAVLLHLLYLILNIKNRADAGRCHHRRAIHRPDPLVAGLAAVAVAQDAEPWRRTAAVHSTFIRTPSPRTAQNTGATLTTLSLKSAAPR